MNYEHKNGRIYNPETGQTIAAMNRSATPEQSALLAAAPKLLAALESLHLAVTMRPMGQGGLSMTERMALDKARAALKEATP